MAKTHLKSVSETAISVTNKATTIIKISGMSDLFLDEAVNRTKKRPGFLDSFVLGRPKKHLTYSSKLSTYGMSVRKNLIQREKCYYEITNRPSKENSPGISQITRRNK